MTYTPITQDHGTNSSYPTHNHDQNLYEQAVNNTKHGGASHAVDDAQAKVNQAQAELNSILNEHVASPERINNARAKLQNAKAELAEAKHVQEHDNSNNYNNGYGNGYDDGSHGRPYNPSNPPAHIPTPPNDNDCNYNDNGVRNDHSNIKNAHKEADHVVEKAEEGVKSAKDNVAAAEKIRNAELKELQDKIDNHEEYDSSDFLEADKNWQNARESQTAAEKTLGEARMAHDKVSNLNANNSDHSDQKINGAMNEVEHTLEAAKQGVTEAQEAFDSAKKIHDEASNQEDHDAALINLNKAKENLDKAKATLEEAKRSDSAMHNVQGTTHKGNDNHSQDYGYNQPIDYTGRNENDTDNDNDVLTYLTQQVATADAKVKLAEKKLEDAKEALGKVHNKHSHSGKCGGGLKTHWHFNTTDKAEHKAVNVAQADLNTVQAELDKANLKLNEYKT